MKKYNPPPRRKDKTPCLEALIGWLDFLVILFKIRFPHEEPLVGGVLMDPPTPPPFYVNEGGGGDRFTPFSSINRHFLPLPIFFPIIYF